MPSRVLFLHSSAGLYGADLQLVALAGGLRQRGFETAALLPERGELAERLEAADVEVQIEPLAVLRRRLLTPGGLTSLARSTRKERSRLAAAAKGAALVHSNTSVIVGGLAAARANGIPHVVHVREIYAGATTGLTARAWPFWCRRLMRSDERICVSKAVAAQFGPKHTHTIYDGIDRRVVDAKVSLNRHSGSPFSIGVLGRLADWKGQDVLVRALAEPGLAEIGAVGVIAGDAYPGETAPDIRGLAEQLGVADRVKLLGFRSDPGAILASVDVVAVPSTRPDPLPNSALEALVAGLPVVAAGHGGLTEIVRNGWTGLLVPPGDHVALAKVLRYLAEDSKERRRMGEAAADDARRRFGLERMLDQVEVVYRSLGVSR